MEPPGPPGRPGTPVRTVMSESSAPGITAARLRQNPLIVPGTSASLGDNINGPSVIRVPEWVRDPLGSYYLYFAHHRGRHIRLAYADAPHGPWRIHEPGALRLEQAPLFRDHIASPDVHVDEDRRQIRMYYHGLARFQAGQGTSVAVSDNGIDFRPAGPILGRPYFRVFRRGGFHYAIAKRGNSGWGDLARSADGLSPFESRGPFIERVRHSAVLVRDDRMIVFYSRVGDMPERILASTVLLDSDWRSWAPSAPVEVLRPEEAWEGANYPDAPSAHGPATGVRQLRDPCVFEDEGRTFLYYSIAGESGLAMAELDVAMRDAGT